MDWKDELMNALGPVDPANLNIEKALGIVEQHLPKCLYRYRKFSKYELDNLETDCVWLTSPIKYNDPFDSAVTFSPERLSSALHGNMDPIKAVIRFFSRMCPAIAAIDFNKVLAPLFDDMVQNFSEYLQSSMRVCSFSETWDSVIMWSHYTDQHKGFCVEYPIHLLRPDDVRRTLLMPVIYRSELSDVTEYMVKGVGGTQFNNLFGELACLLKAVEWAYEKEWRLVIPGGDAIPERKYPMPKPSRLILGARMSEDDAAIVVDIARRRRIPVFRVKVSRRRFSLELFEVSPTTAAAAGK